MTHSKIDYKLELVAETAAALHSYGYQVYISKDGSYGFYTDGKTLVCFGGFSRVSLDFTGCYTAATREIARSVGTGWGIAKDRGVPSLWDAKAYIKALPPYWATSGLAVRMTTPEQHLKTYGPSSGYTLYEEAACPAT